MNICSDNVHWHAAVVLSVLTFALKCHLRLSGVLLTDSCCVAAWTRAACVHQYTSVPKLHYIADVVDRIIDPSTSVSDPHRDMQIAVFLERPSKQCAYFVHMSEGQQRRGLLTAHCS